MKVFFEKGKGRQRILFGLRKSRPEAVSAKEEEGEEG